MKFEEKEEVETKDYVPDSLNMRVVGMWPFGQGQAIEGSGDTVYVGSGAGIMVFKVLRELVDSAYLEKIGDYRPRSIRNVVMAIEKFDRYLAVSYRGLGLVVLEASDVSDIREICIYPMDDNLKVLRVVGSVLYGISDSMLWVFDVSDPRNITFLSSCYVDTNLRDFDTTQTFLYVVNRYGYLYGIDVSDVRNPQKIWYRVVPWGPYVGGLRSRGGWIYVSTTLTDQEYWPWNVLFVYRHYGRDSVAYKGYRYLDQGTWGGNMDLRGDYLYQSDWGFTIRIWYIGDTTQLPNVMNSMYVKCHKGIVSPSNSNYVYTLSAYGFYVVDATQPQNAYKIVSSCLPSNYIKEMVKVGHYLLVPDDNRHLWILDVSNVIYPELSYYINLPFVPEDMEVYNDKLYISRTDRGFCVYDVSNPLNITLMASLGDSVSGRDITVNYPYVYLYREDVGLYTLDVSDLGNIRVMNLDSTVRYKGWDAYLEDTLFFAARGESLRVYSIGDSIHPYLLSEYIDTVCYLENYNDIVFHDTLLYLASSNGTAGNLLDISSINNIRHVTYFDCSSAILKIYVFPYLLTQYYYWGDARAALLDVSDPFNITRVAYYRVPFEIQATVGDYPYVYVLEPNIGLIVTEVYSIGIGDVVKETKDKIHISSLVTGEDLPLVFPEIYKGRRIDLFVYDVMGRMVKKSSIRVNNGKILLNLRGLRNGVYFVEVKDRKEYIYRSKFVKFGR